MSETCRGHLWDKIIIKLFASSWYIFLTYLHDARSHLYQILRWCLLSRRLWFVVCFGKLSLSDVPIRNNQAASDRASAGAKVPSKWRGRRKKDWISAMLACEVRDVAPSCWKYPTESSSSSNWFTKVLKISIYAAVVMVASNKMGPIMRRRDIPHQTTVFSEWRGSSCKALGFLLAQISSLVLELLKKCRVR